MTDGVLCAKVSRYAERTHHPDRVLTPLRRVGRKGEGRFEPVSWDEALDDIAARLSAIAARDPQAIVPYSYAGTMGLVQYASMDRRFFHRLGASLLERTICASAGSAGIALTLGASVGMDPEKVVDARLILIWGSNPVVSNLHFWSRCQEAKRRGARLVCIDPWRNQTARRCHQWIAPRPGTDAALALAMMHVIIGEGLHDAGYIADHTLGFEPLAARVADWTPERAAAICGLDAGVIRDLAREYATTRPAAIRINYGLQRHHGGGMAVRTLACLPALTGAWRDAAGGLLLSTSGFYGFDHATLERPDLIRGNPRSINMSAIGDALLQADPPIRAIYVYNSNPVAVAPDSNRVAAGFLREDLFTVVHDAFLTDTCDYADIILPADTALERMDLLCAYGNYTYSLSQPAIPKLGESLDNNELFRRLARHMGYDDPCFSDTDEQMIREIIDPEFNPLFEGISFEHLLEHGWARAAVDSPRRPGLNSGRWPTPSGRIEIYSEAMARDGLDPLPGHVDEREGWFSHERKRRFPLQVLSPATHYFIGASFQSVPRLQQMMSRQTFELSPEDAAARGIVSGDACRLYNERGEVFGHALVVPGMLPGVLSAPKQLQGSRQRNGVNINALVSQDEADMGRGPVFYSTLAELEKVAENAAVAIPAGIETASAARSRDNPEGAA